MGRAESIADEQRKTREGTSGKYNYTDVRALERAGITQYKSQPGSNFMRVIDLHFSQYTKEKKPFYGKAVYVHNHVGADDRTFLCMKKMYGLPCAMCDLSEKLKSVDPNDARIKELWPSSRYLFFVFDTRSADTERKGLQWYDAPAAIKDGIVSLSTDPRTNRTIDISSRDEGMDVVFDRVGSGINTKYIAFRLIPGEKPPESWYKNAPDDFEEFLLKPEYSEVATELAQLPAPTVESRGGEARGDSRSQGGVNPGVVQDPTPEVRQPVQVPQMSAPAPIPVPVPVPAPVPAPTAPEVRSRGEVPAGAESRVRGEVTPANGVSPEVRDRIAQLKQQGG